MPTDEEVEARRREKVIEINALALDRAGLEALHGTVWTKDELLAAFEPLQFAAPLLLVRRKSDGARGSVWFQDEPRFYWGWQEE